MSSLLRFRSLLLWSFPSRLVLVLLVDGGGCDKVGACAVIEAVGGGPLLELCAILLLRMALPSFPAVCIVAKKGASGTVLWEMLFRNSFLPLHF